MSRFSYNTYWEKFIQRFGMGLFIGFELTILKIDQSAVLKELSLHNNLPQFANQ